MVERNRLARAALGATLSSSSSSSSSAAALPLDDDDVFGGGFGSKKKKKKIFCATAVECLVRGEHAAALLDADVGKALFDDDDEKDEKGGVVLSEEEREFGVLVAGVASLVLHVRAERGRTTSNAVLEDGRGRNDRGGGGVDDESVRTVLGEKTRNPGTGRWTKERRTRRDDEKQTSTPDV